MKDERRGLPSASKVARYMACPGSYALEQGCDEFRTEEAIRWAESGDRVHAYLAGELSADDLAGNELDVAQRCREQEGRLLETCGIGEPDEYRETRLWLSKGRKKLLSGKPDAIFVAGPLGLVDDYKSGYGDQDGADTNHQIRTNIVLAAEKHPGVESWFGAIIQPLVSPEPQVVHYQCPDIAAAKAGLLDMLERIRQPGAKLDAGPQCRWCPAVLKCPTAKALLQVFGLIDANAEGEVLAGYLVLARAAKPIIKRLEEQAKKFIKDGPGVPGWQLGKPQTMRIVTDPFAAFKALSDAKLIDREVFLRDCVSVKIGELEAAVAAFGKLKAKEARESVNAHLADLIEFKPKEAALEQI
jgi:hypothetical protein